MTPATLVDVLGARAGAPVGPAVEFVGRSATVRFGYPELDARARTIGATLAARGLTGQRVLVALPPGPAFVEALFGCLYAGAVAVPSPPGGQAGVLADAAPAAAIVPPAADQAALVAAGVDVLPVGELDRVPAADWRRPELGPDTLALLQYRAGDRAPRGVMVSHANLLASCRQVARLFGTGADASVVSWLPPYRDMGLVVGLAYPVVAGGRTALLDPALVRADPARWLRLVAARRARISGGPGWALDRCAAGLTDDELRGLDLSTWDVVFTDAAPATVSRFADRLAGNGFRRESVFPCYWLPEATSVVAGRRAAEVTTFDADSLAPGRPTRPGPAGTPVLDRGRPAEESRVAIVDPLTATRCPDGTAGEIWVAGPNVAVGYLGKPVDSERTFCARLAGSTDNFLRTGTLGFLHAGGLHVTELAA